MNRCTLSRPLAPARSNAKKPLLATLGALLLLSIFACGPCAGSLDEEAYFTTEGTWAIVVGSTATISAFVNDGNEAHRPIAVQTASAADTGVLAINSISENSIGIEGLAAGRSNLEISVTDPISGAAKTFNEVITVIEPTRMHLSRCDAAAEAAVDVSRVVYARGYHALVGFVFTDASGFSAGGRGFYPIEVSPSNAGTLSEEESDERELAILIPESSVEPFAVSTTLAPDPVHPGATLGDMRTIDVSEVTDVTITNQASMQRGFEQNLGVEIRAGENIVCSKIPMTLESKTPNICNFRLPGGMSTPLVENTKTVPRINPQAIGVCQIVITLLAAGVEVASTLDIEVYEPAPEPSSGGGGGGGGYDFD